MSTTEISPASAARRARIVEAAARLFAAAPYAEVHMDAIAAAASVAKPTLYRYFPHKELLFVEALEQTLTQLRIEIEDIRAEPEPVERRLRRMIALILTRSAGSPRRSRPPRRQARNRRPTAGEFCGRASATFAPRSAALSPKAAATAISRRSIRTSRRLRFSVRCGWRPTPGSALTTFPMPSPTSSSTGCGRRRRGPAAPRRR